MSATSPRSVSDRLVRPTLGELWTFLAVALPVLAALLATLPTVDLAYQLRAGAEILDGRGIPHVDSWTFTAFGAPWLDQQWGAQVILATVHRAAGWVGLALLRATLVGLISALVLAAIRARAPGMRSRTSALLALAAFVVMAPALALRPQLLGMALFALTVALLAARTRSPRALWLLPVIAAAWANLHGSFVLAPILVGLAWLEDLQARSGEARTSTRTSAQARARTSAHATFLVTLATSAATLVTPFGLGAWEYAVGLVTNRQVTAQVSEWQPPNLGDGPGMLFWGSVALAAAAVALLLRRSTGSPGGAPPWATLLGLLAFAALGATTGRAIAWWSVVAAVGLATLAARAPVPATNAVHPALLPSTVSLGAHGNRLNSVVAGALVLAGIALVPAWRPLDATLGAPSGLLGQAPAGITAALRAVATTEDRVWNPQMWGSWLEFAVPAPSYALDSRIEIIPASVWADASTVSAAGPGWDQILDDAGVTIVITDGPSSSPLATALAAVKPERASPFWKPVYVDDAGAIWVRTLVR
ncbi:MAG: hypothetical protein ABI620_08730 [Chloroflexota bacterium]